MKKRLLAALLTCVMLFSLLPATALAEDLEDPQGSVESSESITVDSEKDEVLNMFHGDEAEELYNKLITVAE